MFHCTSSGHCCGTGSVPGPGTSMCHGLAKKKKKKKKGKEKERKETGILEETLHMQHIYPLFIKAIGMALFSDG